MRKHLLVVTFLAVSALLFITAWVVLRFGESSNYIKQADLLINSGNLDEATALYEKARDTFPFRPAVSQALLAVGLITKEETDYQETYQITPQISPPPAVPTIPFVKPAPLREIRVPILMYHHIRFNPRPKDPIWAALNVSPSQLEEQLYYLTTHQFHLITLDEMLLALDGRTVLPQSPVVLTFDDGYRNFYENAYPLLKKYNVKATSFVITDVIGAGAYLTWPQITEMDKSGLVAFEDHTKHHPDLTKLSLPLLKDEITGSKKDLEGKLRKKVNWFAYPYGSYNNKVIQVVKDSGYLGAVSVIYGMIQTKDTIFLMPRIMVDGRFRLADFKRRL